MHDAPYHEVDRSIMPLDAFLTEEEEAKILDSLGERLVDDIESFRGSLDGYITFAHQATDTAACGD